MITIDILYLIDQLEVLLSEGWRVPLTSKVVVDEEECLNIIDQLRVSIPAEIKKAKRIQQESQKLVVEGQQEADRIVSLAREQANNLLNEEELREQANQRVQAIVDNAMTEAKQIRHGADEYAAETLSDLDERLNSLQAVVRNGLTALGKRRQSVEKEPVESDEGE
ncbi:MAG: ATPase [Chloroflexi bacterium]|nr:ATPase [Chloroflexota bacterium]